MAYRGRSGYKKPSKQWRKVSQGFVNPYNFVGISEDDVQRGNDAYDVGGPLTGVIECALRTRTPLCVPDVEGLPQSQLDGLEHKGEGLQRGVPFFRVPSANGQEDIPIIPGSEIRGVVRSAFEALDNGCFSVNNSNLASARSPFPLRPAILEVYDGHVSLYDAHEVKGSGRSGTDVVRRVWPRLEGGVKTFFYARDSRVAVTGSQLSAAFQDYLRTVDIYRENAGRPSDFDSTHTTVPQSLPSNGAWVVFYNWLQSVEGAGQEDILYLSPAQITRTVFRNRVDDLLGSHASCQDPHDLCESCLLFGMVGSGGQAASRLRFTDATMALAEGESIDDRTFGPVTLKELSSPKPSSLEFYTKRPVSEDGEAAYTWTYDGATFGYAGKGKNVRPDFRRFPPEMPTLVRGRKFFLHHYVEDGTADEAILGSCGPEDTGMAGRTKRNMTVEVVRSDTDFRFKVFFERLDEVQLKKLVWTLCIGENDLGGRQLHMLGHAKPLGLGSCKVRVERVLVRGLEDGYAMGEWDVDSALAKVPFVDDGVVRDYLTVTDFTLTKGLTVSYPQADDLGGTRNSKAAHQWFVANRTVGEDGSPFKPSVHRALPALPAGAGGRSALVLPKYTMDSNRSMNYPPELSGEATVSTEYHPREHGVINDVKYSSNSGSYNGHISWPGHPLLFFHTSRSPKLDLEATPLAKGLRVSFTVGKNVGGRNPNQDCAYDMQIEG